MKADNDVTVYAVNKELLSTDAYVGIPIQSLGTEYYAISYIKDPELMVVATEDTTTVSITWPASAVVIFNGTTYG